MNLVQSETTTANATTGKKSQLDTRLDGRWLIAARISWVVLAVTIVVFNILALPGFISSLLTPGAVQELHHLDFSQTLYVGLNIGITGTCMLLYLTISLLLFWLRSTDRMAFFCSLMLLTVGGVLLGFIVGAPPSHMVWNTVVSILSCLGQVLFVIFFYLFPSGRFVPRWTLWCALLWIVYQLISTVFFSAPFSGPPVLFPFFLLTILVAQVYRYRVVSTSRERQQTKWVVSGIVISILLIILTRLIALFLPPAILQSEVWASLVGGGSFYLALMLLPIFMGIAILRSQLFDIDLIINRTLVYGLLTGLLVTIYAGLTIGLETLVGLLTRQTSQPVIVVISTLAIAALFQPLRHRLQGLIDRRFYRRKYDAAKTVAAFSTTLRTEMDLEQLQKALLAVVEETMQPSHVSLWLPPAKPARPQLPAWSSPPPDD